MKSDATYSSITAFFIRVSFHGHWRLTWQQGKGGEGPSFIPLYYFHLLMNIQTFIATLHIWNDYHILVAQLVSTRLLLNEIKRIIELPSDWLMWLASTITLVLQANRLTKCTNHPNCYFQWSSGKIIQSVWHKTQQFVGNKAKGRMSKRVRKKKKAHRIFQKTPCACTCTCAYQETRNVRFSENVACFVFL